MNTDPQPCLVQIRTSTFLYNLHAKLALSPTRICMTENLCYNCLDHLELAGGRRGTLGGLTEAFGNIHLNLRDDAGASR